MLEDVGGTLCMNPGRLPVADQGSYAQVLLLKPLITCSS